VLYISIIGYDLEGRLTNSDHKRTYTLHAYMGVTAEDNIYVHVK